jgi:GTP-dependent phosphoenolpyruvate carboxykinase
LFEKGIWNGNVLLVLFFFCLKEKLLKFGVAPGTNMESNRNAMMTVSKNSIFTNVALTDEVCDAFQKNKKSFSSGPSSFQGRRLVGGHERSSSSFD